MEPPPKKCPQIIISPYLWIKILESWTAHLCLKKVLKVEGQEDFERKNKCRLWRDSNPGLPKPYSVFLRYMKNHLDCSKLDKVFTTFAYYFHLLILPFFHTFIKNSLSLNLFEMGWPSQPNEGQLWCVICHVTIDSLRNIFYKFSSLPPPTRIVDTLFISYLAFL